MSAYIVDQVHIDVLVETALLGPTDIGPVRPDRVWSRLSWTTRPPRSFATFAELDANRRTITRETADETGEMLISENVASVRHLYTSAISESLPGPIDAYWERSYRYTQHRRRLTAVEGLAAIAGYEYQACERPDHPDSEAAQFCAALRSALIRHLPGYADAPWTWDARTLAAVVA